MKFLLFGILGVLAGIAATAGVSHIGILIFFVIGMLGFFHNG